MRQQGTQIYYITFSLSRYFHDRLESQELKSQEFTLVKSFMITLGALIMKKREMAPTKSAARITLIR